MNNNEIIAQKNEMLKQAAKRLKSLGKELIAKEAENKALKDETIKLAEKLTGTKGALLKAEKEKKATIMVDEFIDKGQLDPIKREDTIATITESSDSIEKISGYIKLRNGSDDIGELVKSKTASGEDEDAPARKVTEDEVKKKVGSILESVLREANEED